MSEKAPKKKAKAASKKAVKPKKKAKEEEEDEAKVVTRRVVEGPPPGPTIESRHAFSMYERPAKGYSIGELESVGLVRWQAKSLHVPIDIRRRTTRGDNVERLRGWYNPPQRGALPEAEKQAAKAPPKRAKSKPKR